MHNAGSGVALELLVIAGMTPSTNENLTVIRKTTDDPYARSLMIDELIEELVRKQLREAHSPVVGTEPGGFFRSPSSTPDAAK